ncbi:hypothetical protein DUI87_15000 [Hirundo rustica rustica]|uniref:Reelin domain-containing protein n=1 Tax=Hirundo rustica rustica TaxID=333673 RepID=A0A3M0KCE9_HIRRU|nr:hypothetical protein DUI87_15000 [Hirundo rustica rustica]
MAARSGTAEALVLFLLWFAALEGAAGSEPPLKCEDLRLGQYPERGRGRIGGGCCGDGPGIVGPSDGSSYIIDYYGARLTRLTITNATFRKMQTYP